MLIENPLSHDSVEKYLKTEYLIGCKFVVLNRKIDKKLSPIELTDNLLIKELVDFYEICGFRLSLINSDGLSIPRDLSLKEARDFRIERAEDFDFKQLISSLNSISQTSKYSDIEWVKRIFRRAIKEANNPEDIKLIRSLLERIHLNNDKFFDSDLSEISELIE